MIIRNIKFDLQGTLSGSAGCILGTSHVDENTYYDNHDVTIENCRMFFIYRKYAYYTGVVNLEELLEKH